MTDMVLSGDFSVVSQGIVPPIADATYFLRLGDTKAKSLKNLMGGPSFAEALGVIVPQPTYATLDGATGTINTGILETSPNGTIFCIARAPGATGTVYLHSAQGGATSAGLSLEMTTTAIETRSTFSNNATVRQPASLTVPDRTAWRLYVGEAEQGVGLRVADETRGLSAAYANTNTRNLNAATTMRIGGRSNTTSGGPVDIHQIIYVPRILTGTERARVLAFMRAYAAARGITV